ncbi:MAG: hypothetical protein JXA18_16015 [Chitinispirillaceae bacterium]|nr:hypothetical protein [Chitinispirillaceae bacterium]
MIRRRAVLQVLLLSILVLSAALYVGSPLPGAFSRIGGRDAAVDAATTSERLALIDSALRTVPAKHTFEYTGGFENPFRQWRSAPLSGRTAQPRNKQLSRNRLQLKGILLKERPLAILEDGTGETFIRGVGEKAVGQSIVSIADNRVTLRDHVGTYELIVEEE